MTWYLDDVARLRREREALEALVLRSAWLTPVAWRFDESGRLCVDFDIEVKGQTRPVTLQYSQHFPHAPCLVVPRGDKSRWSAHQWGPGGELCLEYGTDNWVPTITGTHMLESAHRLLEDEAAPLDERMPVPSRHETSVGQDLRGSYTRLLLTRNLQEFLQNLSPGSALQATASLLMHEECAVDVVREITLLDGSVWKDASIPRHLQRESCPDTLSVLRVSSSELCDSKTLADFIVQLATHGMAVPENKYVIVAHPLGIDHFLLDRDTNSVHRLAVVPAQLAAPRTDSSYEVLNQKRVAIVGCGSLGSKLAVMLSRCGVEEFLLIDDDVVFPDNFVRHDLDWRDVGTHKADSVARRIQLVNPLARCTVRRHKLGGQESSGSLDLLLSSLGAYDMIIDATAEPRIFNLLSAVVAAQKKPLLWALVYAGGLGGLIARHRPGLEPPPQRMRLAIDNWFEHKGKPVPGEARDYGLRGPGVPQIADDADVTAIAAHASRLAVDTLIAPSPSVFPCSAYLIGLKQGSVFTQPFDTYPITVPDIVEEPVDAGLSPEESVAEIMTLIQLSKRQNDGTPPIESTGQSPTS